MYKLWREGVGEGERERNREKEREGGKRDREERTCSVSENVQGIRCPHRPQSFMRENEKKRND